MGEGSNSAIGSEVSSKGKKERLNLLLQVLSSLWVTFLRIL
jgi:hypothetical protein